MVIPPALTVLGYINLKKFYNFRLEILLDEHNETAVSFLSDDRYLNEFLPQSSSLTLLYESSQVLSLL